MSAKESRPLGAASIGGGSNASSSNAVATVNTAVVPTSSSIGTTTSRGFRVHSEEAFVANLEAIVERDFYPDLPRLRAKQRYLDARAAATAAGAATVATTPALSEAAVPTTPSDFGANDATRQRPPSYQYRNPELTAEPSASGASTSDLESPTPTARLDAYLCGNTSEDNASFQALLDEAERRRRIKYAWFYQQQADSQQKAIADSSAVAASSSVATSVTSSAADVPAAIASTAGLDSWQGYRVRNALMYPQADAEDDIKAGDNADEQSAPALNRRIVHANTRFRRGAPFSRGSQHGAAAAELDEGVFRRPFAPSRVGPDGREVNAASAATSTATATAGTSSYLATPSPAPGMLGESPLMTWGDIDGTPWRLDDRSPSLASASGSAPGTPLHPSGEASASASSSSLPYFRIPAMPTVQLADRLSRHRKAARLRDEAVNSSGQKSTAAEAGKSPARHGLSPAIKRLLKKAAAAKASGGGSVDAGGIFGGDKALRASYRPSPSPSPSHTGSSRRGGDSSTRSNASLTDGLLASDK